MLGYFFITKLLLLQLLWAMPAVDDLCLLHHKGQKPTVTENMAHHILTKSYHTVSDFQRISRVVGDKTYFC